MEGGWGLDYYPSAEFAGFGLAGGEEPVFVAEDVGAKGGCSGTETAGLDP